MSDQYTLIKTVVFAGVTDVRFYPQVLDHIREEHPDVPILLPSLLEALSRTIANPTHVEISASNASSFVFVDSETTNWSGNAFRIPIRMVEGTSGRITTAFFADTIGTRNIVWRRP